MKFLSALVSLVAFSVVQAMPVRDAITGANPAAIYCVEIRGGTLVKQTTSSGDVDTVCSLPNGNQTEQWALFRADPLAGCKVR